MKKNLRTEFSTRQYMVQKDFEIYYYSDRHIPGVAHHVHDYYEFYFFLEGDVALEIEGKEYELRTGDMVLLPPGVGHHAIVKSEGVPYRRFVFWISRDYVSRLMQEAVEYGYLMQQGRTKGEYVYHNDVIAFNTIQLRLINLIEEVQGSRYGREAAIRNGIREVLLYLNRIVYERRHQQKPQEGKNLYVSLVEYIEAHLEEELTLKRLAEEFYVSSYHISHIFKENIGISLHQYILKKRLEACKAAMAGEMGLTEIGIKYGFSDYSCFYRAFVKEYGIAPKTCREAIQKNKISGTDKGR